MRTTASPQFEKYFQFQIYEAYKPKNLAQARDYIDFMLRDATDDVPDPDNTPQHILDYLEKENEVKLPKSIDENEVLCFDQNFECGNLDSVYLTNSWEYELIMKVDTNTRGNTYWFMFKVTDFQIGIKYKFNVLNFTRNCEKFYSQGMNIVTKAEKRYKRPGSKQGGTEDEAPQEDSEWRYNTCESVVFLPVGDLVRSTRRSPETGEMVNRFFSKLSFSYKFKEEDRDKEVVFAYAVPYGYTDLLKDLELVK